MHWYIPTQLEDANEGGTFYVNACLSEGVNHTETAKKVTCKKCKALYAQPNRPDLMAARLYSQIIAEQWLGREQDFSIEVKCNGCETDLDVFGWYESVTVHDQIARCLHFLNHVAYDHAWGTEVLMRRDYTPFSVYEVNYGMGKIAQTQHEEAWREREGLVPVPNDTGRASFEARIVE
jgi:ribosomal protein S27E